MNVEYEVRVLEINKKELISKIESLGGKFIGEYNQRRYVYDFNPKLDGKWIRLRTNGEETTLTIKEVTGTKIDSTKELEVIVSNFDDTNQILKELGYIPKGYQENKRIRYMLNGVELDIDHWPMIPIYLEIEGKDEQEVNAIIDLLEVDKSKITSKNVQSIYLEEYGINIEEIKDLRF